MTLVPNVGGSYGAWQSAETRAVRTNTFLCVHPARIGRSNTSNTKKLRRLVLSLKKFSRSIRVTNALCAKQTVHKTITGHPTRYLVRNPTAGHNPIFAKSATLNGIRLSHQISAIFPRNNYGYLQDVIVWEQFSVDACFCRGMENLNGQLWPNSTPLLASQPFTPAAFASLPTSSARQNHRGSKTSRRHRCWNKQRYCSAGCPLRVTAPHRKQ